MWVFSIKKTVSKMTMKMLHFKICEKNTVLIHINLGLEFLLCLHEVSFVKCSYRIH